MTAPTPPSPLLDCITIEPPAPATACVIWMHGLGADGNDFVPIVPELGLSSQHHLRFVFPNAPRIPVTINGGYVMRAWYDIVSAELDRRADEAGVRRSQAQINALIEAEIASGIPAERIVLAGFSQGGVIALQTALRHPQRLAGVIALSTYLACADSLGSEGTLANQDTPILMIHGSQDPVVPFALAQTSAARLRTHGYRVEWHDYPMPHAVCAEEVADIATFLQRVLP